MRPSNLCDAVMQLLLARAGRHDRKPRSRTQRVLRAAEDSARTGHKPRAVENATARGSATESKTTSKGL